MYQQLDRLDFQDPFSVQVLAPEGAGPGAQEGSSAADDWYLPAYVNIEYHHPDGGGHIKSLDFHNCSFVSIPDSVWGLPSLEKVEIHAMEDLISLTTVTSKDNTTTTTTTTLQKCKLKELIVDECYSLDKLPPLPDSLTHISIKACHRMTFLPKSIVEATNLKVLQISNMMLPMGPSLPSTLEELKINGSEIQIRKLKMYLAGDGCGAMKNLKSLRLSMCDLNNEHLKAIWREILPICPQLQRLNLSGNNIRSLSSLVVVKTTPRTTKKSPTRTTRTRLRSLNLEGNPVVNKHNDNNNNTNEESNHLLTILEQNPELCCLGGDINWKLPLYQNHSAALQKALDDNFARILKASSSSCPLALWSNVLQCAAANTNSVKNNNVEDHLAASLIYNVLQGPAFVERLPHTY
ncbi:unnamed protein product [Cylindrotheca closterium]|uniref:Uncharacterized protein n=1 Tax=Cylindrotheca closterium TaxID=2856 RepID=A0AAD2JNW6_9STRA|nr:unnamed protein product [Cylindrotheca closterium]